MRVKVVSSVALFAAVLVLASTAQAKSPWAKPVQSVDPFIPTVMSVFGPDYVSPAAGVPEILKAMYKPRSDGKALDGVNLDLARAVYPDVTGQPVVWLVPGRDRSVYAVGVQRDTVGGGSGGPVDDEFFKQYGSVTQSGGRRTSRSPWRIQTLAVVPDAVKVVRLILRKRDGKRFARDIVPRGNVVVSTDRRVVAVRVNGRTFKFGGLLR